MSMLLLARMLRLAAPSSLSSPSCFLVSVSPLRLQTSCRSFMKKRLATSFLSHAKSFEESSISLLSSTNAPEASTSATEAVISSSTSPASVPQSGVTPTPNTRYASHTDFVQAMQGLTGDPLQSTGTNVVIYRGNIKAKIMVVGEAPGETEDIEGKPFVGRAGKLLDDILAAVGLDEDSVYITNVVLRRPPKNRTPLAPEVAWYRPLLMENIRLVDPHIILLAGACACKAVLTDEKRGITKIRGEWFERQFGGEGGMDGEGLRLCMPMFHPSYLLRNPSRRVDGPKWLTWQDIKEVRRRYDEVQREEGEWGKEGEQEGSDGKVPAGTLTPDV
ncbi:dna polymerase [Nannochloropsis oceanica]